MTGAPATGMRPEGAATCPQCGAGLATAGRFCSQCGAPLSGTAPRQVAADPTVLAGARPAGVTALALLDVFLGCVLLITAGLLLGQARGDRLLIALAAAALTGALLHGACALGLWGLRNWGRSLQLVLSVVGLLAVPVGTLVSLLVLAFLLQPGCDPFFSGRPPESWSDEERAAAARAAHGSSFIVVVVAGVILMTLAGAAGGLVVLPRIVEHAQRARLERTMTDMRVIGRALEAYATDNNRYPDAQGLDGLLPLLEPRQARRLPRRDGWSHPFRVVSWWDDAARPPAGGYLVGSAGADGRWEEPDLRSYAGSVTSSYDADLVFDSGEFTQYPDLAAADAR